MALFPVAGCRIYIGGVLSDKNSDFVAADFASQVWTEIDGYTNMGPIGDTGALITQPVINRGRDVKQKGTANAPSRDDEFVQIVTDPGQILLLAASQPANKNNYAFRIDLNDAVGGAPSKRLFVGLVMSFLESGGGANTMRLVKSTTEVNSNVVRVAAT